MPTLNATVSGASANTLGTLVEANAYFADTPFASGWALSDTADRQQCLIHAMRGLEVLEWAGYRTETDQRLPLPRVFPYHPDIEPDALDGTAIPRVAKEAQFEYAYALWKAGVRTNASDPLAQFSAMTLPGGLSFQVRDDYAKDRVPDDVLAKVRPLLLSTAGTLSHSGGML